MYHGTSTDFFLGFSMLGILILGPLVLAVINLVLAWKLKLVRQVWYSCFNLIVAGSFPFLLLATNQFEWPQLLKLILQITAFGIPLQLVYLLVRLRMRRKHAVDAA